MVGRHNTFIRRLTTDRFRSTTLVGGHGGSRLPEWWVSHLGLHGGNRQDDEATSLFHLDGLSTKYTVLKPQKKVWSPPTCYLHQLTKDECEVLI